MRSQLVQLRCRPTKQRPIDTRLTMTTADAAKPRQPHRHNTEQRRDPMKPPVLDVTSTAARRAVWPQNRMPAILILIFGGLRAWASRYIRKGVRRSRREWWWLGEGEREKQIVPGGEDQECGDRRQLVEEVVAWSKLSPCGTPKIVANVADGMKCEGEQVQGDQNGREVLFSVAEAVFEVVALVFENVEGFVLDFPPRPAARCEFDDVFAAD